MSEKEISKLLSALEKETKEVNLQIGGLEAKRRVTAENTYELCAKSLGKQTNQLWTYGQSRGNYRFETKVEESRLKYGIVIAIDIGSWKLHSWGEGPEWKGGDGYFHQECKKKFSSIEAVIKELPRFITDNKEAIPAFLNKPYVWAN